MFFHKNAGLDGSDHTVRLLPLSRFESRRPGPLSGRSSQLTHRSASRRRRSHPRVTSQSPSSLISPQRTSSGPTETTLLPRHPVIPAQGAQRWFSMAGEPCVDPGGQPASRPVRLRTLCSTWTSESLSRTRPGQSPPSWRRSSRLDLQTSLRLMAAGGP
jgi:hypothetical protein